MSLSSFRSLKFAAKAKLRKYLMRKLSATTRQLAFWASSDKNASQLTAAAEATKQQPTYCCI